MIILRIQLSKANNKLAIQIKNKIVFIHCLNVASSKGKRLQFSPIYGQIRLPRFNLLPKLLNMNLQK